MKKYLDHGFRIAKPIVTPLLNYALGWFSPELFGTGFVINTIDDNHISGTIPYSKLNCNSQSELHAGLVMNSGFELIRQLLVRHIGQNNFHIESYETTLKKNNVWNKSLDLKLELDEVDFDRFFMDMQKNAVAQLKFDVMVQKKSTKGGIKSKDILKFDLVVRESKRLLA